MSTSSNNVQELSISLIKNLAASVERKRQHSSARNQQLLKAREEVSSVSVQTQHNDVIVDLGGGYHVQYPPKKALETIDRMIMATSKYIVQYNKKLESAKKAIEDLERISADDQSINSSGQSKSDTINSLKARAGGSLDGKNILADAIASGALSTELENDPFLSEDGLPIMEIVEELDEEGNITSSQVRPQKSLELADFANNDLVKALEGRDDLLKGNYNDESSTKLINGKPVFGPVKPEWLIKGLPNPHNIKRIRAGVYGQELPEESSQKDTAPETQGTKEKELIASNVTPADKNDEKNKSSTTDSLISTESQKKSHPTAKADNKSTTTSKKHDHQSSSDNESNDSDDSDSSSSQPPDDVPYSPNEPAIPTSELLELELIADDIDDESDFEAGPEAFGMDTDGDGENEFGEDDDEDEDEFGRTRGSLFP